MLTEQHKISYFADVLLLGITSCYPWAAATHFQKLILKGILLA
jgi:hypothetical protein